MISADVERLDLQEAAALDNINTPEEYDAALKKIRGERDA